MVEVNKFFYAIEVTYAKSFTQPTLTVVKDHRIVTTGSIASIP